MTTETIEEASTSIEPVARSREPSERALDDRITLPGGATLRNRIAKSAMSERLARDRSGAPGPGLPPLYRRWARGGIGLLITGNVMVEQRGVAELGNVVIEDAQHLDALRAWAAATGEGEDRTPLWMQLNHGGRQVPRLINRRPVAPSAVPVRFGGLFARPRPLTHHEIEDIIEAYARAAAIAREAGFDGVQIHGAHGYLVSQFLSPLTNRRDDAWGGTAERRRRFLLEIIRCMRATVGDDFPIGVKLNSADFQRGGFDEAESMAVVRALDSAGIDLLEISGGTYESAAMFEDPSRRERESTRRREAFFIDYAERVRDLTSLPLMVTGGFRTKPGMSDAVTSGAVDIVGMARPMCIEPDLPGRLLEGTSSSAMRVDVPRLGVRKIDSALQGGWHSAQLRRMGRGLEPDPDLGGFAAAIEYLRQRTVAGEGSGFVGTLRRAFV